MRLVRPIIRMEQDWYYISTRGGRTVLTVGKENNLVRAMFEDELRECQNRNNIFNCGDGHVLLDGAKLKARSDEKCLLALRMEDYLGVHAACVLEKVQVDSEIVYLGAGRVRTFSRDGSPDNVTCEGDTQIRAPAGHLKQYVVESGCRIWAGDKYLEVLEAGNDVEGLVASYWTPETSGLTVVEWGLMELEEPKESRITGSTTGGAGRGAWGLRSKQRSLEEGFVEDRLKITILTIAVSVLAMLPLLAGVVLLLRRYLCKPKRQQIRAEDGLELGGEPFA